jgi:ABC-type glycerol-3-phosphate transport system substrate-binding protein
MKKKLLSVLMAAVLSISLVACGGEETTEAPAAETTVEAGDYTEEQIAFIEEYQKLIDDYNAAVDVFNANEELT